MKKFMIYSIICSPVNNYIQDEEIIYKGDDEDNLFDKDADRVDNEDNDKVKVN